MVIELSDLKSYAGFKNRTSHFQIAELSQYQCLFEQVAGLKKSGIEKVLHFILYPKQK